MAASPGVFTIFGRAHMRNRRSVVEIVSCPFTRGGGSGIPPRLGFLFGGRRHWASSRSFLFVQSPKKGTTLYQQTPSEFIGLLDMMLRTPVNLQDLGAMMLRILMNSYGSVGWCPPGKRTRSHSESRNVHKYQLCANVPLRRRPSCFLHISHHATIM